MYNVNPLREQAKTYLAVGNGLAARPGKGYYHRPMCKVIALRGRYQGCGDFEGCNDPRQACEVLLEYPRGLGNNNAEGAQKWHFGPISSGGEWRPDMVVEFELTLEEKLDRLDAAYRIIAASERFSIKSGEQVTVPVLKRELDEKHVDIYDVIEAIHHYTNYPTRPKVIDVNVVEVGRGFDVTTHSKTRVP